MSYRLSESEMLTVHLIAYMSWERIYTAEVSLGSHAKIAYPSFSRSMRRN